MFKMVQNQYIKCTGCNVCKASCKFNAIEIVNEKDGFWYPHVNEDKCRKCGECLRTCPVANISDKENLVTNVYVAWNLNEEVRYNSSSGGIFSAIAEYAINKDGFVVGASFDEDVRMVKHIIIDKKKDISRLRGSKYLQSYISEELYIEVRNRLKEGKYIVFSGTPCQIAGLKKYVHTDYENLVTIDIVCHGVPSPKIWKSYLTYMEKKQSKSILDANFRSKINGWKKFEMNLVFKDQSYSKWFNEDLYGKAFIHNMFLRECCYKCLFKTKYREADITLGDFWKVLPKYDTDDKGCSLVIINSKKGCNLLEKIKYAIFFQKVKLEDAYLGNYALYKSSSKFEHRDKAFKKVEKKGFEYVVNYYFGKSVFVKIRRKIIKAIGG